MKKIDASKWKEFLIGDLFDIHPTKAYKKINIELFEEDGANPVIVNTGFNNGVGGYANLECTEKAGTITFTDTAAKSTDSFFYQERDFIGYIDTREFNPLVCMFLASCLQTVVHKYPYNFGLFPDLLKEEKIKLPVIADGTPDWIYMGEYMRMRMESAKTDLVNMQSAL